MGSRLYKLKYVLLPANLSIFIIYVYSISTIRSLYFLKLLKYQLLILRIFKVVLIQPSGTDGTYPPRWWSLRNWSHCVGPRKLGSTWRLFRLIKCQEVGGDPELSGQGHEQDQSHPDGLSSSPAPKAPPLFTNTEQSWAGPEKGLE